MIEVQVVIGDNDLTLDPIIQRLDISSASLYKRDGSLMPVLILIQDPSVCVSHIEPIYQKGVSHVSPEKTDGGEIEIEILASASYCHLNIKMTQMTRI